MNFKYSKVGVVWRLMVFALLIVSACIGALYQLWEVVIGCSIAAIVMGWSILQFVTGMHRKVQLFFDAVRYEDGSLRFPEQQSDPHLQALYTKLNEINQLLTEIRAREAQSEQFFKAFMQRSSSGLLAVDQEGYVEIINDAALNMIGLQNLSHIDRLQQQYPALHEALLQLEPDQSTHVKLLGGNQLQQLSIKQAHIRLLEKEYRIFSLYDIKNELEEHELDTWQKLIRIMTHEIMNSITPISSLSQTLNRYFEQDGQAVALDQLQQTDIDSTREGLQVIEERANGLRNFVENYRKLSKLPQAQFQEITLDSWLASIQLLFKPQADEHTIRFTITNTYAKPTFLGDEKLLTHVLLNLLNNAVQALEQQNNKHIEIIAESSDVNTLRLKVIDNGKGFTAEEQDKLFLPFYTSRENGSGIGLSLSRQIMRMHKGSISASSQVGKGAEFVLEI